MEEKIGLVFTWDPKSKTWMKERGPEDAAPPPASPIDDGAIQTYFQDPADGRWHPTILGLIARQLVAEAKGDYRSPFVAGLAIPQEPSRNPRLEVWSEQSHRRSRVPLIAGGALLLVLIAASALAAEAFLAAPKDADASSPRATAATTVPATVSGNVLVSASATPSTAASSTASAPATASDAPARTPQPVIRTPAPTPLPAPVTIRLSGRTPTSGVAIFYSGPNIVQQNAYFDATFSAVLANGTPSGATLNVRLGSGTVVNAKTDGGGTYTAQMPANCPAGSEPLTVFYGNSAEQLVLGSLTVK